MVDGIVATISIRNFPIDLHVMYGVVSRGTQRQARELISGLNLPTGARLLSFNRTQSRAVIGLLTGHNTLRRHLHVMGLSNNPTLGGTSQCVVNITSYN